MANGGRHRAAAAAAASRRLVRRKMRLGYRHGNLFYLFLCAIMLVGPVVLLAGGSAVWQSAWIASTFGRDRDKYTNAVDGWTAGRRGDFQRIKPTFVLNSTVPSWASSSFIAGETASNAVILDLAPVRGRLPAGAAYIPLRYSVDPPFSYHLRWRDHSEIASPDGHRSLDALGLSLYAAGDGKEEALKRGSSADGRAFVGRVLPLPLLRERQAHMSSHQCSTNQGLYNYNEHICTTMEVLRRICIVIRPIENSIGVVATTPLYTGSATPPPSPSWEMIPNSEGVGCEQPASVGDARGQADLTVARGQLWRQGGPPSHGGVAAWAGLYASVYLGEFLEDELVSSHTVHTMLMRYHPGSSQVARRQYFTSESSSCLWLISAMYLLLQLCAKCGCACGCASPLRPLSVHCNSHCLLCFIIMQNGEVEIVLISADDPDFVASTLPSFRMLGVGAHTPEPWLSARLALPMLLLGCAMSAPWCLCVQRSCCDGRGKGVGWPLRAADTSSHRNGFSSEEEQDLRLLLRSQQLEAKLVGMIPMGSSDIGERSSSDNEDMAMDQFDAADGERKLLLRRQAQVGMPTRTRAGRSATAGIGWIGREHHPPLAQGWLPQQLPQPQAVPVPARTPWSRLMHKSDSHPTVYGNAVGSRSLLSGAPQAVPPPTQSSAPRVHHDRQKPQTDSQPLNQTRTAQRLPNTVEWVPYLDEKGRRYYHNPLTDVTSWNIPSHQNIPTQPPKHHPPQLSPPTVTVQLEPTTVAGPQLQLPQSASASRQRQEGRSQTGSILIPSNATQLEHRLGSEGTTSSGVSVATTSTSQMIVLASSDQRADHIKPYSSGNSRHHSNGHNGQTAKAASQQVRSS